MEKIEREFLRHRREWQLQERRARRRHRLNLTGRPTAIDIVPIVATTLAEIEAVTARPGFIRQQLTMERLTTLRRWYLELKMMVADDLKQIGVDRDDDKETALQAFETELLRDRRCYDVVYRAGLRALDARESLLDDGASMDVRELLSFSIRVDNFVCRVTGLYNGKRVLFSSSEYVEHLQTELERFLNVDTSVDTIISYISKALKAQ